MLDDFQKSRDILLRVRNAGGICPVGWGSLMIGSTTAQWLTVVAVDASQRTHTDEELTRFLPAAHSQGP